MTKAELFSIKCKINQALQILNASYIITDAIHVAQRIFDSTIHSYQQQLITILKKLRLFFNKYPFNSVKFWNCPSNGKWSVYKSVDKNMKKFNLSPLFSYKTSWDFSKKNEYDSIIRNWQMIFQVSCYDLKSLEWDRRTTLVLSNTRELNRDLFTN